MSMTNAQLVLLKAAIVATPAWNNQPLNSDGAFAIAADMNLTAVPDFMLWRSDAKVADISDAINFASYTPTDSAADNDTAPIAAAKTNRLLAIQTKQMNLQMMLQGRESLNANKTNIRNSLRDSVINLPSGVGGAATQAGGASGINVMNACTRKATSGEKILAGVPATTGGVTANLIGYEGSVQYQDVEAARALP